MASLDADEDFPLPAVEALRRRGHDVLTAAEDGRAGRGVSDEAVVGRALDLGRAVLTHNRKHFRNLHNAGQAHGGLVVCTRDIDFGALAERIDTALAGVDGLSGRRIPVVRPPG